MPRTPEANQQLRDQRQTQIRATAAAVFAQNGYVGTRVDDIAAASGISKGLIYHYFGGKAALFVILVRRAAEGSIRLYQAAEQLPDNATTRLSWLVDQAMVGIREQSNLFMVIMQALVSDAVPSEARAEANRLAVETHRIMTNLIRDGQREGTLISGDPEQLSLLFSACIEGLAVSHAMTGTTPAVRNTLLSLFTAG
jgi:AcrR family transcriptional regulator